MVSSVMFVEVDTSKSRCVHDELQSAATISLVCFQDSELEAAVEDVLLLEIFFNLFGKEIDVHWPEGSLL